MTDVFTERPSSIDPPVSDRQALGVLAIAAGIAAMAGPRRTRPLAGFLYGVALSRVHGAGRQRLEMTLSRLFDERTSATTQIRHLKARVAGLEREVRTGERSPFGAKADAEFEAACLAADDTGGGACA
jgi:hypothetical protein